MYQLAIIMLTGALCLIIGAFCFLLEKNSIIEKRRYRELTKN